MPATTPRLPSRSLPASVGRSPPARPCGPGGRITGVIERSFARNYWREHAIVRSLEPMLDLTQNVLDLGAGSCKVAKTLTERHGIGVTVMDVVDHNMTDLVLRMYDGHRLPYD